MTNLNLKPLFKRMLFALVCFGLVFSGIISCRNKSNSPTEFIDSALGSWRNGCENNGLENSYTQVTIHVTENTFSFENTLYYDPSCSQTKMIYTSTGKLVQHERFYSSDNKMGAKIDFSITGITLMPSTETVATNFAMSAFCLHDKWTKGVSVDIANCEAVRFSKIPRTEYDLYAVEPGSLNTISDSDILYVSALRGNTTESRPTDPDYTNPYYRIDTPDPDSDD